MSEDKTFPRREVLKGAAVGGLTVAAASAALKANAQISPGVSPPGRPGSDTSAQAVFSLEFEEQNMGYFTECSGIGSEHEIIEHKIIDKSGQEVIRKLPGRLKWTDITLKRGVTSNLDIWDWRQLVVLGKVSEARGFVSITQHAPDGQAVARWNFENAWPSKVEAGSELAATGETPALGTEVRAVEEVTIVVEGMYRDSET
jgi:phage tail-like protein